MDWSLGSLDLNHLDANWTTLLFLFFLVMAFFFLSRKTGRVAGLTLGAYVALALVNTIKYFNPTAEPVTIRGFTLKITSFLLITGIVFVVLSRVALQKLINEHFSLPLFSRIFFAITSAGLLTMAVVSFLPAEILIRMSVPAREIFSSDRAVALWMLAPMLSLLFAKRREE